MSEAPTAEEALAQIRHLRATADDIDRQLHAAVRTARIAGAEVTAISDAARISRPTVYSWLDQADEETINVADAIDAALRQMLAHLDTSTIAELHKALRSRDVAVKVRRYELGVRNLPPGPLDDPLRAALQLADHVIAAATQARESGGRWPSTVPTPA